MKNRHKKPAANKRKGINPLRIDPTRTATLRRAFASALRKQFGRLKARLVKLIVDEDAFGLVRPKPNPLLSNTRFKFASDPEKIKAFQEWLKTEVGDTLTGQTEEDLWRKYVEAGYRKGAARSFDDARAIERTAAASQALGEGEGASQALDFYAGTKDEFLRSAFVQPVAIDKVKLLAGRSFDDLEGVTADMGLRMSRSLTDGLVQGKGPREIASSMAKDLDITRSRAETIATTEIIRAHAEGQLMALDKLGVEELGVAVEWSSAGDDRVCPKCADLEGIVITLAEAAGMLPRHPRCRCSWIPANVGEDDAEQKKTQKAIDRAVKDAGPDESDDEEGGDWGPGKKIAEDRPESILGEEPAEGPSGDPEIDARIAECERLWEVRQEYEDKALAAYIAEDFGEQQEWADKQEEVMVRLRELDEWLRQRGWAHSMDGGWEPLRDG